MVADTVNTIAVHPEIPLTIYAGTEGFGVMISEDGGQSFGPRVSGLGNLDVLSLAVDKQFPNLLFAGTRRGLFKTDVGGLSWKPTDVTDGAVTDISIDDGTRPRRVRITTFGGGMAVSEDEGETFHPSNHGLTSLDLTSIEAEPRGGTERLWVTMKGGDGVAYSDDGGQSWTSAAGEELGNHNVNDLIVEPDGRLWVATEGGIFFSGDGGRSWKERNVGLPAGVPVTSLAIDPMNGEILAGLDSGANGGVYRGGENGIWSPFNAGLGELRVQELTLVRSPESLTLFAATAGDGLYASDLETLGEQTPSVTTRSLPLGRVGREYSIALAATGGSKPYGWSLVAGSLPPGLGLTASGTIAGMPISSGSYDFTIQVTDARSSFGRKSFSIRVSAVH
jgi:ligand-binding sensor domain-containing protein